MIHRAHSAATHASYTLTVCARHHGRRRSSRRTQSRDLRGERTVAVGAVRGEVRDGDADPALRRCTMALPKRRVLLVLALERAAPFPLWHRRLGSYPYRVTTNLIHLLP